MSTKKDKAPAEPTKPLLSAMERAHLRYPDRRYPYGSYQRTSLTKMNLKNGYSQAIKDLVEPLEADRAKLIETVQECVNALQSFNTDSVTATHVCDAVNHTPSMYHGQGKPCPGIQAVHSALDRTKDIHGITPNS